MKKDISIINKTEQIIPNITITCVIIRFINNKLEVLLQQPKAPKKDSPFFWGLPQKIIKKEETTMDAVQRLLEGNHNFEIGYLDQFRTFEEFDSISKQKELTIGYCAFVRQKAGAISESPFDLCKWVALDKIPNLSSGHDKILSSSLRNLNTLIKYEPVVFDLLPQKFTLLELMCLYEQILRMEIDKSNFRRKILSMNLLVELNEKQHDVSHRAAKFYGFDLSLYRKRKSSVFSINF